MRKDLGDLTGLKESIFKHGLIQPIVLDAHRNLIAGHRRYCAHVELELEFIDYLLVENLSEDERAELEFEENFWRKSFTWQEEALGILRIYRQKKQRGALEGWEIAYQQVIAEMFAMSVGAVNYILTVAQRLEKELSLPEDKRKYHAFGSVAEAYRLGILGEKMDALNAYNAEQLRKATSSPIQELQTKAQIEQVTRVSASPELLAAERQRYDSNPLNKIPFNQYWEERQLETEVLKNTISISNKFFQGDCIDFMLSNPGVFDHIITDPPYAIDMEMLNQQNQSGGMKDLDRVIEAHQVDENKGLLARFFPAAFSCTKDNAFVIVCGDMMLWQYMYDLAIDAGFAVQRWPIVWRKVNQPVMNNCAGYNTSKDYEVAMVCRKPGATLQVKRNSSVVDASNVEVTKLFGHPFGKPFELTKVFVELCSIEGQTILEPFAGAGSLVVQMLRMNRHVYACEKEAHWFNMLLENVKTHHYLKINPKVVFK